MRNFRGGGGVDKFPGGGGGGGGWLRNFREVDKFRGVENFSEGGGWGVYIFHKGLGFYGSG